MKSKWDSTHDGGFGSDRSGYYVAPAEGEASRSPTNGGKNKVYFRYKMGAQTVTIECDLSPGFKLDNNHKLISGHIRLRCPLPDCPGWLHIWHDNKTVYCIPTGLGSRHVFGREDGFDDDYLLPIVSVVEPVACNYRERRDGRKSGCRWKVAIHEGTAYNYVRRDEIPAGYKKTAGGIIVSA